MNFCIKPTLLLLLDGWGYNVDNQHNAVATANTPYWDQLWNNYPHTLLSASGPNVGLPEGQFGNSEVGHMTIGSGRVMNQDLSKINLAIEDGSFFANKTLNDAITDHKDSNSIHILGLLSPGGVHSHEDHIHALLKLLIKLGKTKVYIHAFLDGRDTPPKSAKDSLHALEELCTKLQVGKICSIVGRYYAMDRDNNTDRTNATYELLFNKAKFTAPDAITGLEQAYERGETDEFVQPTKIIDFGISPEDTVIFMNFRADRAKQLSYCLTSKSNPKIKLITLAKYADDIPSKVIFPRTKPINCLGEYLAKHNLTQLRLAETEKYAHVTFFFDGGNNIELPKMDKKLIPSPAVTTYDLAPEMSAKEITKEITNIIKQQKYNVIICNLANADMVGHTGNFSATVKAIETLDNCLKEIIDVLMSVNGQAIITADHGNAEVMYDATNTQPHTAHTNSLVPFIYIGKQYKINKALGTLADVAPSLLTLIGLNKPQEMTGNSLLINNIDEVDVKFTG